MEYLDLILVVKLVDDFEVVIDYICFYGLCYIEVILMEDVQVVDCFFVVVDSVGVYYNCFSCFVDGFCYGFGVEVGISIQILLFCGFVGLEGLVIYCYWLCGEGYIVVDYVNGSCVFIYIDWLF